MRIMLENINLASNGGPNSFAKKLIHEFDKQDVDYSLEPGDVSLCFIESPRRNLSGMPMVQRLDGIYFNTDQPYEHQNANIKRTYDAANAVIFQSEFNKKLTTAWFGDHRNSHVVHNGANLDLVNSITADRESKILQSCEEIWCCAASWRPHKRLQDNIRYFQEHSGPRDVLFIAGDLQGEVVPKDDKIKYLGILSQVQLIKLYKTSTKFIHLAWLDHCPNVVVDARASGCQVICSSAGGTVEIAGKDAIVIEEGGWNYKPTKLYRPPLMDFSKKNKNSYSHSYDMEDVGERYLNICRNTYEDL